MPGGVRVPDDRVVAAWGPGRTRRRDPNPVPVRDRPVPDDPRAGRRRDPAGPRRLQLRRGGDRRLRREHPSGAVLGVLREPELLSQRLEARGSPHTRRAVRRHRMGALRPRHRSDRDGGPRRGASPTRSRSCPRRGSGRRTRTSCSPSTTAPVCSSCCAVRTTQAFYREVRILPGTPTLERYRSQKLIALRDFEIEVEVVHRTGDQRRARRARRPGRWLLALRRGRGADFRIQPVRRDALHRRGAVAGRGSQRRDPRHGRAPIHAGTSRSWSTARSAGALEGAEMLIGFAPFQGIDVGIDRRSPVVWSVFEKHGPFPYTGDLIAVTYRPGAPAPYDPQRLVEAMRAAGRRGQ